MLVKDLYDDCHFLVLTTVLKIRCHSETLGGHCVLKSLHYHQFDIMENDMVFITIMTTGSTCTVDRPSETNVLASSYCLTVPCDGITVLLSYNTPVYFLHKLYYSVKVYLSNCHVCHTSFQ